MTTIVTWLYDILKTGDFVPGVAALGTLYYLNDVAPDANVGAVNNFVRAYLIAGVVYYAATNARQRAHSAAN